VLITVNDSSVGLPEVNPERIFEASYTAKPRGLGMGLSICRSIVAAHGGRLWPAPRDAGGVVFSLMLPIEEKALENPDTP
jgi:signal transduction histidine kinase